MSNSILSKTLQINVKPAIGRYDDAENLFPLDLYKGVIFEVLNSLGDIPVLIIVLNNIDRGKAKNSGIFRIKVCEIDPNEDGFVCLMASTISSGVISIFCVDESYFLLS